MKTVLVLIALLLGGCAQLPTMQHCDRVSYQRSGNDIRIEADCRAPIGGSGLPGAIL